MLIAIVFPLTLGVVLVVLARATRAHSTPVDWRLGHIALAFFLAAAFATPLTILAKYLIASRMPQVLPGDLMAIAPDAGNVAVPIAFIALIATGWIGEAILRARTHSSLPPPEPSRRRPHFDPERLKRPVVAVLALTSLGLLAAMLDWSLVFRADRVVANRLLSAGTAEYSYSTLTRIALVRYFKRPLGGCVDSPVLHLDFAAGMQWRSFEFPRVLGAAESEKLGRAIALQAPVPFIAVDGCER